MIKKSKLFKNLLTTVSTLAVITTAANAYATLDSDDLYNGGIAVQSLGIRAEGGNIFLGAGDSGTEDLIKRLTPTETPILADLTREILALI